MFLYNLNKLKIRTGFLLFVILLYGKADAQQTAVLPGNSNYSSLVAPQGSVKYQRQFYLIDSAEARRSGLVNGMALSSIGFNIVAPQSVATEGLFRVYLQNTSDNVSRTDTLWTEVSVPSNVYFLNALNTGRYEWQVRSECNTPSPFSPLAYYNVAEDTCYAPSNLKTVNITSGGARLQWTLPYFSIANFRVEYTRTDTVNWITADATGNYYDVSGLLPGKNYQWKVSSLCTGDSTSADIIAFTTLSLNECNPPSAPVVSSTTDTSGLVSWSGATGAIRYNIQYRRSGTEMWTSTVSTLTSATILGLKPGTTYDWMVRTVCAENTYGEWIGGTSFTTTGTTACYPPESLSADSLTASGVKLTWNEIAGAASYVLRYRKKDAISWENAINPMTLVHDDSIHIPDVAGPFHTEFLNGNSFSYTGNALYVAFEYIDSNGVVSTSNIAHTNKQNRTFKDVEGRDSLSMILSLGIVSMDSLRNVLSASDSRPETYFGSGSLRDSVSVLAVYAKGRHAIPYSNPSKISALIKNYSSTDRSYQVTLTVKDSFNTVKRSETVQADVTAGEQQLVNFGNWNPSETGSDSVIVSIPAEAGENVLNNNRKFYIQVVNNSTEGYDDGTDPVFMAGLDTVSGKFLTRHTMNGCGAVSAAQIYLTESAVGYAVYAVVTDASGNVLANSPTFTATNATTGYHSFYFPSPVKIPNGTDYYIGLAKDDSTVAFSPVGVQYEFGHTRQDAYYISYIDDGNLLYKAAPGRLMIKADIVADSISPAITGNLVLCPSTATLLTGAAKSQRFASEVISYSSQISSTNYSAAKVLGTPDVYPEYSMNTNAWTSSTADGQREYLELRFSGADSINFVDIYEVFNPGSVDTVYAKDPGTGIYNVIYTATVQNVIDSSARIKHISFPLTDYKVDEIRIALNSPAQAGQSAIDAIAIGRIYSDSSFASYEWTKRSGNSEVNVGNAATLNVTDSGVYTLTVLTAGGCLASTTATVTTPSRVAPVITAGGSLSFCAGDSVKLKSDRKGGNTWSTGATTDSIYARTGGSYWVEHDDNSGCGPVRSSSVAVTVNSLPVVSISGQAGICSGSSTSLTADVAGNGNNYLWSTGSTSQTTVVSNITTVRVTVTDINSCKGSASVITYTAPNPLPVISGVLGFCQGGSTVLSTSPGFSSYLWNGGGTTSSKVVNTTGKHILRVTNSFGCIGFDSVIVAHFPGPQPNITGNLSICGMPTTLNAGGGFATYLWSTGETTQTISVSNPGLYSVTVTDGNVCSGFASARATKDSLPPRPGKITPLVAGLCNPPSTGFSIRKVAEATHYVWFVPEGVSIVSGQGDTAVTLSFGNTFTSGYLMVASSNACGQSGDLLPRVMPLNIPPVEPLLIEGPVNGVCNSIQYYSTPEVASAISNTWTVPAGVTILSGQGTNRLQVRFSNSFNSGVICVNAVNACGTSSQKCITINGRPVSASLITGPEVVCKNQSNVVYSTPLVAGATRYSWTVPQGARVTSGQNTNSVFIKFGTVTGNVSVTASNACGNSIAISKLVTVNNCSNGIVGGSQVPVPNAEVRFEPEVLASAGNSDQVNNVLVDWTVGEPCIESIRSGINWYTQGFHQPLIIVPSIPVVKQNWNIQIAPNPVATILNIKFSMEKDEDLTLVLTDVNGKVIHSGRTNSAATLYQINMSAAASGMYYLKIKNNNGSVTQTFKVAKIR